MNGWIILSIGLFNHSKLLVYQELTKTVNNHCFERLHSHVQTVRKYTKIPSYYKKTSRNTKLAGSFFKNTAGNYYTIIDYWSIGHDVISTWEYQYWPRRSRGQYWYSQVDITSCPMPQKSTIVLLYNFSKQKKSNNNNNNKILAMDYVLDSLEFLFLHDD